MQQPELRGGHCRIPAADHADDLVRGEKRQVVDPGDRGVHRPRGEAGEQRQADREDVRETDRIEQVEHHRPEQADFSGSCMCGGEPQAQAAGHRKRAADDHLAQFVGLGPGALEPPFPECSDRDKH